jgi:putative flippase GtrA
VTRLKDRQFFLWATVGTLTVLMDFALFVIAFPITNSILFSNLVAVFISSSFNYLVHRFVTFGSKNAFRSELSRYGIYQLFVWFIGSVFIKQFTTLGISLSLSKVALLILIAPLNFILLKKWVYKTALNRKEP